LRDFIPKLLKLVQGNMLDKNRRPDWWPSDLPWSDTQTHIKYQQVRLTHLELTVLLLLM